MEVTSHQCVEEDNSKLTEPVIILKEISRILIIPCLLSFHIKSKGCYLAGGCVYSEVAVREPPYTSNDATEMECFSSSTPLSPSPEPKRAGYPFPLERVFEKSHAQVVFG